ncbi:MAG: outer membrane beta-barrel protein [Bacteroidota bacterium]
MTLKKLILASSILFAVTISAKSQNIGFRFGVNSGMFITELGESDVPHPDALLATPALSTEKFTPQPTIGIEGEILFELSPSSYFGVEADYSRLKGFNDSPPVYNYYLTPYNPTGQGNYTTGPVAFNTTLINVAVNWKYFFFKESSLRPFVKLTGVVAFVGTDFTDKSDTVVYYARGTSNSEKGKWPAFHVGGGLGFEYKITDNVSFQADGTLTVINSDIINGVPNFTYLVEDEKEILKYHKRPSLNAQISVGLVYYIETTRPSAGAKEGKRGRVHPNLPFYRIKK